ncbi:MAG: 3-isopropylmalate dehydratase small subunit [Pseudomonadota bacterium]
MSGWHRHDGQATGLAVANVDTDQIIPARFMSTPRSAGYGAFLFHDLQDSAPQVLRAVDPEISVLFAERNFGCGSSREAAVYALIDAGIRVVAAPSFGDIFASNAVNNGLLPARIADRDVTAGLTLLAGTALPVSVDLNAQTITLGARQIPFTLDPVWRTKLIYGWDDIDLTRQHAANITAFRDNRKANAPWVWPSTTLPGSESDQQGHSSYRTRYAPTGVGRSDRSD